MLSAALALLFYYDKAKETVIASVALLLLSLFLGLIGAFIAARDIR
jgi:hypothetical protein